MVQYYPHAGAGQADRLVQQPMRVGKLVDHKEAQTFEEAVINLLEPVKGQKNTEQLRPGPTQQNQNVHVFYYAWYGNPSIDGLWSHWNHK